MTQPGGPPRGTRGERAQLRWYRFARAVVVLVCRLVWRVEVTGEEHVPAAGAFVVAPVHRSNLDTLLCGFVTRRPLRYMAKDTLWKHRWAGAFLASLGGFPVHRGHADREALRVCEEALRTGKPVVLFPEGTRKSGLAVQPLMEGAAFVAARTGVPIVPVGIGGSEWAMPKGSKMMKPVKIAMVIGPPIPPPARVREGGRVSRRQVSETSDRLHAELQALFDEALRRAGRA